MFHEEEEYSNLGFKRNQRVSEIKNHKFLLNLCELVFHISNLNIQALTPDRSVVH